jgi:hypothetical protein
MAKAESLHPKRPAAPRPRVLRPPPTRPGPACDTPQLTLPLADESLRRWFEEEVEALQRLAHTQRLKGDYVAAQTLEGEIRSLAAETTALLQASLGEQP